MTFWKKQNYSNGEQWLPGVRGGGQDDYKRLAQGSSEAVKLLSILISYINIYVC